MTIAMAPELQTTDWFNTGEALTLSSLRGRVVLIEAFQMLCPGCVAHGLPQAQRVAHTFRREDIVVLGLHTVFEHHAAQGSREALAAFLHEYRITFPVAIDKPGASGGLPRTMQAYRMRGTPTLILIDRQGQLRKQHFGQHDDLLLGAEIMSLIQELPIESAQGTGAQSHDGPCNDGGCPISGAADSSISESST